ncbi:hypothetical protein CBR65_20075 [Cellvibrio sp. PSBB006]|nr:hypothetical protein CBR65_20075 [Cellvibrio sp. PSBB006]
MGFDRGIWCGLIEQISSGTDGGETDESRHGALTKSNSHLKRTKTLHSLAQGEFFSWKNDFKEPLENVCEAASARQKQARKRSLLE